MASYNEEEYEKVIRANALRAIKRLQEVDPQKYTYNVRNADAVTRKYAEYQDKLRKWRPIDQMNKGYEFALNDYNADSLMNWLEGAKDYKAPDEYEGQTEASKILPLLKGIAKEGDDWYTVGSKELKKKAKALGYNTDLPGAFDEFLKLVSKYQLQYDRAQLLKEGQQGANYWLNKFFYPSSTQEAENAVLTGEGGDEETLNKLRWLDRASTTAMTLAPSLRLGKVGTAVGLPVLGNPLVNSTIDAGLQGLAEGVRQLGTGKLSTTDQKAEIAPVLVALGAGATRPGLSLTAGGLVSQAPGQIGKDIARGVRTGARVGGSMERQEVADAIKLYNKDLAKNVLKSKDGVSIQIVDETGNKYNKAVQVPEMAKLFGVAPKADGTYDAKVLLNYYDTPVKMPKTVIAKDGTISYAINEGSEIYPPKAVAKKIFKPTMKLGKEDATAYSSLFPDRAADMNANRAAYNAGEIFGQLASEAGGRIEPVIGTNPFKVYSNASVAKSYTESYKTEPWYKKLDVESKKIIDEAFKKKAEEEEEE